MFSPKARPIKLYQGDALEIMKTFPDNSVDTIITDPPYGLEFMGREWDKFNSKTMGKRLMTKRDAHRDSSIGRKNDPYIGARIDKYIAGLSFQQWVTQWAKEVLRIAKPGATMLVFGGTRTWHRLACGLEDAGWIIKDTLIWLYGSGFPKATDVSKQIDKKFKAKREKLGIGKSGKTRKVLNAALHPETFGGDYIITKPATPEAKLWDGYKSHALKPAYEPIIMCIKPNEGSYAENALKWGVAGLNIDAGRIGKLEKRRRHGGGSSDIFPERGNLPEYTKGRFPANVLLDEEAAKILDEQAPQTGAFAKVKSGHSGKSKGIYHDYKQRGDDGQTFYNDGLSGASRFFYVAKASGHSDIEKLRIGGERHLGCENLYWLDSKQIDKKLWTKLRQENIDNKDNKNFKRHNIQWGNIHPTVKPFKLVKYLVKLTSMQNPNQVYLDPFMGSGTTGIACKELKKKFIGIDKEPEYIVIAKARIKAILTRLI